MPLQMSIRHEFAHLRRAMAREKAVYRKAAARALNRTGKQIESAVVKAIAAETGLKQKDARVAMRRTRATQVGLTYTFEGRGRPLNLIRYGARQTKKGVRAAPWKKRLLASNAWIGNHGRTVFTRKGSGRQPIRGMYGPGIADTMERAGVKATVKATFRARWPVNLAQDLRFYRGRK